MQQAQIRKLVCSKISQILDIYLIKYDEYLIKYMYTIFHYMYLSTIKYECRSWLLEVFLSTQCNSKFLGICNYRRYAEMSKVF